MKINELYESILLESKLGIWYHGSPRQFTKFDASAARLNRGSNPEGVYLTKSIQLARQYAGKNGYVYMVIPKVSKTFVEKKTKLDDKLAQSYKKALMKHTSYRENWIDSSIIPQMYEDNRLKNDIDGNVKTETYVGAGYDSYQFVDMFDVSLVVFNPNNARIVGVVQDDI